MHGDVTGDLTETRTHFGWAMSLEMVWLRKSAGSLKRDFPEYAVDLCSDPGRGTFE